MVTFNLETHITEFCKVFYDFFDNFLSSVVFILFLEQLLVDVRFLDLILEVSYLCSIFLLSLFFLVVAF